MHVLGAWRRSLVLAPALVVLLSGCEPGGAAGTTPVERMAYDAGVVEPDEVIRHTFVVENPHDQPLRIVDIRSTCSCTTASIEKGSLIPAQSNRDVEVVYDIKGRTGGLGAQMLLMTDSAQRGNILLSMECKASGAIEWYPGRLQLGPQSPSQEITLWDAKFEGFEVTEVTADDPAFQFSYASFTGDHGHRSNVPGWKIKVAIDAKARAGRVDSEIRIGTTSKRRPEITVPVVADVEGDLFVDPPRVFWGFLKDDAHKVENIKIRRRGDSTATVVGVTVDSPAVNASLRPLSPDRITSDVIAMAGVAINHDKVESGQVVRAMVRITTTSERVPELVVPVSFMVSR